MREIKIDVKVPSEREYRTSRNSGWKLAKNFELEHSTKEALILQPKSADPVHVVMIEVGGKFFPENCYIRPLINALRKTKWISDEASITIQVNKDLRGVILHF